MNNITTDAVLKLLPTGGKSLPPDDGRLPAFGDHLDRARAERTAVTSGPSPPPTPTVCRTAPPDSSKSSGAQAGTGDATSRKTSDAVVDEAPHEDGPQHEDETDTADVVEISAAAVAVAVENSATAGAVAAGTADSGDKKPSTAKGTEAALKAAQRQSADVAVADAAAVVKTKSAAPTPTVDGDLAANPAADTAAELPITATAEVPGKASRRTTDVKQTADSLGDKNGQTAHKRSPSTATAANQAATASKDATRPAVANATALRPAETGAAETVAAVDIVAAKESSSADRTSSVRRESGANQNQIASDTTSPFTQILVSAEPSAAGTSVVTADRAGDSADWITSDTNEGSVSAIEASAPVKAPREVADAGPRVAASPQQGDARPSHAGRLEGIPVAAGRPQASETHDQISQADRVRLVQRVARALQSASDRGGEVRLRLSPPELGSLRMEVIVQHGQLSAHIETETPAAKSVLLDNLPALRSRLAEQDITVARFDVDVMDNPTAGNHQQYDQDGDWNRQGSGARTNQTHRQRSESIEPPKSTRAAPGSTGELNIVV